MRYKHIYNMYGFVPTIQLLCAKIVKKSHFLGRSKFTFLVLYKQDMRCNKILFLNIKGHALGEKLKKRTRKTS
jgi:hypothetical protein